MPTRSAGGAVHATDPEKHLRREARYLPYLLEGEPARKENREVRPHGRVPGRTRCQRIGGAEMKPCDPPCPVEMCIEWSKVGMCAGLCEDCPPEGYPTDKTRCATCPRRVPTVGAKS